MNDPKIKPRLGEINLGAIDNILERMSKEDAYRLALHIKYITAKGVLYGSRIAMMSSLTDRHLIDGYEASNKEFEEFQANLDNLVKKYELK